MKTIKQVFLVIVGIFYLNSCDLERDNPLDGIIFNSFSIHSDTNNNGIINKGETVRLRVSLKNNSTNDAETVKAWFSTTSSHVTSFLPKGGFGYGDMEVNAVKWAYWDGNFVTNSRYEDVDMYTIEFVVSNSVPANTQIPVNIKIVDKDENTWSSSFNVTVQ